MYTHPNQSARLEVAEKQSLWQMVTTLVLAFWLSASLLLDLLVMPSLYVSGMMTEPGFVGAGYSLFWLFNRLELVCAATSLTGLLVLRNQQTVLNRKGFIGVFLASLLFVIALIYTYILTPNMSALGIQLDLFSGSNSGYQLMTQLQEGYWILESLKLTGIGILLSLCCRNRV